jgi:hypothetical protein
MELRSQASSSWVGTVGKPALASAKFSTESESRGKNPYSEKAPIKTLLQPERGFAKLCYESHVLQKALCFPGAVSILRLAE